MKSGDGDYSTGGVNRRLGYEELMNLSLQEQSAADSKATRRKSTQPKTRVVLVVVLMMLVSSLGRVGVVTVARVVVAAAV